MMRFDRPMNRLLNRLLVRRLERLLLSVAICICLLAGGVRGQSDGDVAIELSGFSVSEAYDLQAGDPLDLGDRQLMKLLFRSGKVSRGNFEKWSQFADDVSWQQISAAPQRFRFWTFKRKLRLQNLSLLRFPEQIAADELKGVYLARCVNEVGQVAYLITRSAPRKLPLKQSLDQPISFAGFFYNNVAVGPEGELMMADGEVDDEADEDQRTETETDSPGVPLFIANRFSWYPAIADDAMGVTASQVELAARGVDVGLFDFVRQQNSKPLSKNDSDAFYQMLAAVNSARTSAEAAPDSSNISPISFTELMSAPASQFGNKIALSGRLRQCVPIEIVDADRQTLVGAERYYQVSLFPNLKGRDVVVRTSGEESIKFEQFPVTVCFRELPQGMTAKQLEGRPAEVIGNFYRFIKYQSKVSSEAGQSGQISPLVMASVIDVAPQTTTAEGVDLLMRVLLVGILLTVAAAVGYGVFKDRKKRSRLIASGETALPEKIDLSPFEDQIEH